MAAMEAEDFLSQLEDTSSSDSHAVTVQLNAAWVAAVRADRRKREQDEAKEREGKEGASEAAAVA